MVAVLSLALVSTILTNFLIQEKGFSPIRASSAVTILIVSCMMCLFDETFTSAHSGAVLGGTFIGMTDSKRLTGKLLFVASVCYSLGYYYLVPFNKGFGGVLGFLSCTSTYIISRQWRK